MQGSQCPLQNRILFHCAHKTSQEEKLMECHTQLIDSLEDQLSLASIHYLRGHYQVSCERHRTPNHTILVNLLSCPPTHSFLWLLSYHAPIVKSLTQALALNRVLDHSVAYCSLTHLVTCMLKRAPRSCAPRSPHHSLTHPPTHSLTHSLAHSLTHSLTLSPTHSLTHSLTVALDWVCTAATMCVPSHIANFSHEHFVPTNC